MKYTDEKQFAAANIFGKGQPNDATRAISPAIPS